LRKQKTLKRESSLSGIGLHTGGSVKIRFCPAGEDTGIVFRRTDIKGNPEIPATVDYVQDTSRSTNIGIGDVRVHTIEHVLAAVRSYEIDNLIIEVFGSEPPVGDGSSAAFLEMIEASGIQNQEAEKRTVSLKNPVYFSDGHVHMVAIPAADYHISYTLHYPEAEAIKSQYFSTPVTKKTFKEEIGSCRTFSLYEEISFLIDRGLIKGGSLDNAVVIKDDVILSKEGLRFPDEMVRHKVLDLIGDLSLVGVTFNAHIIAIRSGHKSNVAFAKKIYNQIKMENS
jgi:UDP-3-O-[3-hydroxymyristoyl] N-acetylglucosamine deacetylase